MIPIIRCFNCKNYIGEFKCIAFPNGIPNEIISGENEHLKPLPKQDNQVVFEELNKPKDES